MSSSEPRLCFLSSDTCACSPLPSSGSRGRSLRKPCGSPPSQVLRVRKTAPPSVCGRLWSPLAAAFPLSRAEMVSSPGFLGNPFESMPRARDSGDPARPRNSGRPDAAFRLVNGVGIATSRVFGAESSWPASLLCTLRTHQSPGEWQHSLSACVLALAMRDLHPLDSIKGFSPSHLRFPPLPRFSQRDNNVGPVKHFLNTLLSFHLKELFSFVLSQFLFSASTTTARL